MAQLQGKKIAIIATDGVEAVELTEPKKALEAAGAKVDVISLKSGEIQGFNHDKPGPKIKVDKEISQVKPEDYHNLVLPGGVANPDSLRTHPEVIKFIKSFVDDGKVVASICHGPWTLIEAGVARGRILTSWPSLKTDINNAGGTYKRGQGNYYQTHDLPPSPVFTRLPRAATGVAEGAWIRRALSITT
jgi:protease I